MYNSFESISVRTRLKRHDVLKANWVSPVEQLTFDQLKKRGYFSSEEESLKSFEKLELNRKSKVKNNESENNHSES